MFKKNIGNIDRIIRIIAGIALVVVSFVLGLNTILSIIALIFGIILTLTALISFCPMYTILKIDTTFAKEKD